MGKKIWSNAEVVELGLENTKSEGCSVNFDGLDAQTDGIIFGCIWKPSRYEKRDELLDFRCKYFDLSAPCSCRLKEETLS